MISIYNISNKEIVKRAHRHIQDFVDTFIDDLNEAKTYGDEEFIYEDIFPRLLLRDNKQLCINVIEDLSEWVRDDYLHTLKPVYEYALYNIIQRCRDIGEDLFNESGFKAFDMNYCVTYDNIHEDDEEKLLDLFVDTFDFYELNCFLDEDFLHVSTLYELYKIEPELLKRVDVDLDEYIDLMPNDIAREYKIMKKNVKKINISECNNDKKSSKRVFISYSWDNEDHKNWILKLAATLLKNGIDVSLDQLITQNSRVNLNSMMLKNIKDCDYILVIMTENYAKKADNELGGVGFETKFLVNYLSENISKIIPVLKDERDNAVPFYLKGAYYYDLSNENTFNENLKKLIYNIHGECTIEMPKLGKKPNLKSKKIDTFDIDI